MVAEFATMVDERKDRRGFGGRADVLERLEQGVCVQVQALIMLTLRCLRAHYERAGTAARSPPARTADPVPAGAARFVNAASTKRL